MIILSFAPVKEMTFLSAQKKLFFLIAELYNHFDFLLDSGVLKEDEKEYYHKVSLKLTNREVRYMFLQIIRSWFGGCREMYNGFVRALLSDDLEGMNDYINEVSSEMFSRLRRNSTRRHCRAEG